MSTRGFVWSTRAWYAQPSYLARDAVDSITFGLYNPQGGTDGEMEMRWVGLGTGRPTPKLCIFDDAWAALSSMPDLIEALGRLDNQCIDAEEFIALLKHLGFNDLTAYNAPGEAETADHPIP